MGITRKDSPFLKIQRNCLKRNRKSKKKPMSKCLKKQQMMTMELMTTMWKKRKLCLKTKTLGDLWEMKRQFSKRSKRITKLMSTICSSQRLTWGSQANFTGNYLIKALLKQVKSLKILNLAKKRKRLFRITRRRKQ